MLLCTGGNPFSSLKDSLNHWLLEGSPLRKVPLDDGFIPLIMVLKVCGSKYIKESELKMVQLKSCNITTMIICNTDI